MDWTRTVTFDQISGGKATIFKKGPKQIVVLQKGERVFAFDNRCPHEGYPLSEGSLDNGCILTCNWHNWKFDLSTGKNLLGEDNVNVYPTKTEGGFVWVDLAGKSKEALKEEGLSNLVAAFDDQRHDRIARVLARLHFDGVGALEGVKTAVIRAHNRLEYGMTHAFAAAADWVALYDRFHDNLEIQLIALTETVDHMAFDSLRRPVYPFNQERKHFDGPAFLDALEGENEPEAIAYLEGALASGMGYPELQPFLLESALAHYRDFGHSLIYVKKAGELIKRLGVEVEGPVLRSLVRSLIFSTREDFLPDFRLYAGKLAIAQKQELLEKSQNGSLESPFRFSINKAMDWVLSSLKTHTPQQILHSLVEAAGKCLLHFDLEFTRRHDLPVKKNAGWLTITHTVTFANAIQTLCQAYPRHWRAALLQMACFIGRSSKFMDRESESTSWQVENPAEFMADSLMEILDHGLVHPIYSCHKLKLYAAIEEDLSNLPETAKTELLAGFNRFMNSPLKQKFVRRTVNQALSLVGKDYA